VEKPQIESCRGTDESANHDEHHADADRDSEHTKELDTKQVCRPPLIVHATGRVEKETGTSNARRPRQRATHASEQRSRPEWHYAHHGGSRAWGAGHRARAAEFLRPRCHVASSHSRRRLVRSEASAVVDDPQLESPGMNAEVHVHGACASVSPDVVKCLLREAVQRFVCTWNERVALRQLANRERHLRPRSIAERITLSAQRVFESGVLHGRRLQLIDERLHFDQRLVRARAHGAPL